MTGGFQPADGVGAIRGECVVVLCQGVHDGATPLQLVSVYLTAQTSHEQSSAAALVTISGRPGSVTQLPLP